MKYNLKVGNIWNMYLFVRSEEIQMILNHLELCKITLPCSICLENEDNKCYSGSVEEVIDLIKKDFPNIWSIYS